MNTLKDIFEADYEEIYTNHKNAIHDYKPNYLNDYVYYKMHDAIYNFDDEFSSLLNKANDTSKSTSVAVANTFFESITYLTSNRYGIEEINENSVKFPHLKLIDSKLFLELEVLLFKSYNATIKNIETELKNYETEHKNYHVRFINLPIFTIQQIITKRLFN